MNISPDLQQLFANTQQSARQALPGRPSFVIGQGMSKLIQRTSSDVLLDITIKSDAASAKQALAQLGFRITGEYSRVLSGYLPINKIDQLTTIPNIRFAKPAYQPFHWSVPENSVRLARYGSGNGKKAGPVISQGDTAQASYLARKKYNVSGKGVKVGVISDSYNWLGGAATGVLADELPGGGNGAKEKANAVQVLEDYNIPGATDEGRAMAEIIHDVAPGASIVFHTGFNGAADFAQGIQDLASKGCQVIVDDVNYIDEPFFQDGIIAQSVDQAAKKGVTYFSSAGNSSDVSYESDFHSSNEEILGPGGGTGHNFSAPDATPRFFQPIYIPAGGSISGSLQWDQSSFTASGVGCESDLDIVLIDGIGNIVAGGFTNNLISGDPIEAFSFTNTTSDYTFFLVIVKKSGPDPLHLKYNLYKDAQIFAVDNPAIPGLFAPSLVGHAKANGAIAVAAASFLNTPAYGVDTPKVEFFSALGGVPNYFDTQGNRISPEIRLKPDITAPDGGNTSFFDPFGNADIPADTDSLPNFFGTSASAPHAAGVAALMIEAEKRGNLTTAQIRGVMGQTAIDMDNIYTNGFDKGFDMNTGYGFVQADKAVEAVRFPKQYIKNLGLKAVCSTSPGTTRSWKISNPNPFQVTTHWLLLGSGQQGTIVAPPGETTFSTNAFYLGRFPIPNLLIADWDDNFGFTRLDLANSNTNSCGISALRSVGDSTDQPVAPILFADAYPNPATTTFRVYLSLEDGPANLQLFSIDGKKLMEQNTGTGKTIVNINASQYRPGVYILQIRQGSFNKTLKLVKQ